MKGKKRGVLTAGELSVFCSQLALIVKAGISIRDGLHMLQEEKSADAVWKAVDENMEKGFTFADALQAVDAFPAYMTNMVRMGEEAGRMDDVLEGLGEYYARNESMRRRIRSAVTYPAILIVMMLAVILVILVEVMPVFQDVYQQLGSDLSPFAQGAMEVGRGIARYAVWILVILVVFAAAIILIRKTARGHNWLSQWVARIFRKMTRLLAAGRFAAGMALMLTSGVDVDTALDMTAATVQDEKTQRRIADMKTQMQDGMPFADAIVQTGIFSGMYGRMLLIGFRTGTTDTVMKRIADAYNEEADMCIDRMVGILEPSLIAALAIVVGMILLSVMLPLMGVMSAIG